MSPPRGFGPSRPAPAGPPKDRLIRLRDGEVALFWKAEDPRRSHLPNLAPPSRALAVLATAIDPVAAATVLRNFYKAHWTKALAATAQTSRKRLFDLVFGAGAVSPDEAQEFLGIAAAHVASDVLRLERIVVPQSGSSRPAAKAAAEPPPPAMAKAARTELTWIGIELVDEQDQPVPGEAVHLFAPCCQHEYGDL